MTWTDWQSELCHHGIKDQKWGKRRFQNPDGSLTEEGKKRYLSLNGRESSNAELHNAYWGRKNGQGFSDKEKARMYENDDWKFFRDRYNNKLQDYNRFKDENQSEMDRINKDRFKLFLTKQRRNAANDAARAMRAKLDTKFDDLMAEYRGESLEFISQIDKKNKNKKMFYKAMAYAMTDPLDYI